MKGGMIIYDFITEGSDVRHCDQKYWKSPFSTTPLLVNTPARRNKQFCMRIMLLQRFVHLRSVGFVPTAQTRLSLSK